MNMLRGGSLSGSKLLNMDLPEPLREGCPQRDWMPRIFSPKFWKPKKVAGVLDQIPKGIRQITGFQLAHPPIMLLLHYPEDSPVLTKDGALTQKG